MSGPIDPESTLSAEPSVSQYAVHYSDIESAADILNGVAHHTPTLSSRQINEIVGAEVYFKCENFQRVGAFKFRGGYNAVSALSDQDAELGVCTHSSGNHAQAIALAAKLRGVPAYIVMPTSAPQVKRDAVEGYGAQVIECEPTLAARESTAQRVIEQTGATFIHPYDHPKVIAGQGTAARELIFDLRDQGPELDLVIAPIGGGGLMSGTALSTRALLPQALIWGAEPLGADDAYRSFMARELIPQTGPNTICDGLLTSLGQLTWPIIRDHLERVIRVTDAEVITALRLILSRLKIVIEPSCAAPLAALIKTTLPPQVKRVGVILSGGNVDLDRLSKLAPHPKSPEHQSI